MWFWMYFQIFIFFTYFFFNFVGKKIWYFYTYFLPFCRSQLSFIFKYGVKLMYSILFVNIFWEVLKKYSSGCFKFLFFLTLCWLFLAYLTFVYIWGQIITYHNCIHQCQGLISFCVKYLVILSFFLYFFNPF